MEDFSLFVNIYYMIFDVYKVYLKYVVKHESQITSHV